MAFIFMSPLWPVLPENWKCEIANYLPDIIKKCHVRFGRGKRPACADAWFAPEPLSPMYYVFIPHAVHIQLYRNCRAQKKRYVSGGRGGGEFIACQLVLAAPIR